MSREGSNASSSSTHSRTFGNAADEGGGAAEGLVGSVPAALRFSATPERTHGAYASAATSLGGGLMGNNGRVSRVPSSASTTAAAAPTTAAPFRPPPSIRSSSRASSSGGVGTDHPQQPPSVTAASGAGEGAGAAAPFHQSASASSFLPPHQSQHLSSSPAQHAGHERGGIASPAPATTPQQSHRHSHHPLSARHPENLFPSGGNSNAPTATATMSALHRPYSRVDDKTYYDYLDAANASDANQYQNNQQQRFQHGSRRGGGFNPSGASEALAAANGGWEAGYRLPSAEAPATNNGGAYGHPNRRSTSSSAASATSSAAAESIAEEATRRIASDPLLEPSAD